MTILFDATRPVNVSRNFGQGIDLSQSASHPCHTAADVAEMTPIFGAISDARDAAMDADYDRRAAEFFTQESLDRGYLIPHDIAEFISRTSSVGHPA